MELGDFPALNACLNTASAILLALGWGFIKRGRQTAHRNCMIGALIASAAFLGCYLYYHFQMQRVYGSAHTKFLNPAWFRPIYLLILISHLIAAIAIVPLVILTVGRAIRQRFDLHKRIARWTWPLWMYVSVTGVVIYLLLYQVFPQK
jgi:uncharacterized membrane protein YozB (DUF420 family)